MKTTCPSCKAPVVVALLTNGDSILLNGSEALAYQLKDSVVEPIALMLGREVYTAHTCEADR